MSEINVIKLNVEINNNVSLEVMGRNIEYAFRLYTSEVNRGIRKVYTYFKRFRNTRRISTN